MQAFENLLAMRPDFVAAHRYVSRFAAHLGRTEAAEEHRKRADAIAEQGLPQPVIE